jgi:hypothetical protein
MKGKKLYAAIAVVLVIVIGVPYAVYAFDYAGNYNVQVAFTANVDLTSAFSVSAMTVSCEPTEAWDFWDILKGHGTDRPDNGYQVYLEITRSSLLVGYGITAFRLDDSQSIEVTIRALDVPPGEAQVRLYIEDVMTSTIVYDRTVTEQIP